MISDVISDAQSGIQEYLDDPTYDSTYGPVLTELEDLLAHMDEVRSFFDAAPGVRVPAISQWRRVASPGASYQ